MENVGLLRVLKVCAAESFGEAALEQEWTKITSNHDAVAGWFALALSDRLVDAAGVVTDVLYKVGDQLVCAPVCGGMCGIPPSTVPAIDRAVCAGARIWRWRTACAVSSAAAALKGRLKTGQQPRCVVGRRRWTWRRSLVTGARRRGRQRRSQD